MIDGETLRAYRDAVAPAVQHLDGSYTLAHSGQRVNLAAGVLMHGWLPDGENCVRRNCERCDGEAD